MQSFRRIGRQNGYLSLRDNLPVIDLFIEIVHSAASHLFACRERLFPRFEPREFWQKRWMNVDDATGERLEHRFVQHAHETGENHDFDSGFAQHFHQLFFCPRL